MNAYSDPLRYSILDPTGNVTALVESPVPPARQPELAAALMARHPAVEQVGFVRFFDEGPLCAALRMAGGEFCGNASMSAAALCLLRRQPDAGSMPVTLRLQVSGAQAPVAVRLWRETGTAFRAGVRMPPTLGLEERSFSSGALAAPLPLVRLEGISHAVIGQDPPFFALLQDRPAAERAVRSWCEALGAEGLGLMFLEGEAPTLGLTPLVYVPGSGTVFWENSCASGSAALGWYLAERAGRAVSLALTEPGGVLRVESDPAAEETWLYGRVALTEEISENEAPLSQ